MKKVNNIDILLVTLLTCFTLIFVIIPELNDNFIKLTFEYLLLLFLPGYSFIAAIFVKKSDLSNLERLVLSFGSSIVFASIIGITLNYAFFGTQLTQILVLLSILTFILLFMSSLRRKHILEDEKFSIDYNVLFKSIKSSFTKKSINYKIISVIMALFIVIAISATIYAIVSPKEDEKFTEFYILDLKGNASDYPTNLFAGQTGKVNIGVINHENVKTNYKLIVKLDNQIINEKYITLSSEDRWEYQYKFTVTTIGQKQKMEFLLYKLPDDKNVYRSLYLWIDVN